MTSTPNPPNFSPYTVRVYATTFGHNFMVYTPIGTKVYEARTRSEVDAWISAHPYANR